MENLKDYEEWEYGNFNIEREVPGVTNKEEHTQAALKALTLEALNEKYPTDSWARVYTDGSAKEAVRDGGAGIYSSQMANTYPRVHLQEKYQQTSEQKLLHYLKQQKP